MAAYTTIDDPEAYFQTVLYTGNGADGNAITLPGDTAMQPDFVWIKERSTTNEYRLYDDVRGVNAALHSSTTGGETAAAAYGQFESFDSDGFTVGQGTGDPGNGAGTNQDGATIVAWCWKESATAGFDIVSYTGNATNRTISHSLSAVPKFIIVRVRDSDGHNWMVQHASLGETKRIFLEQTNAASTNSATWNDTAPTSSVFTVGTNGDTNGDGNSMIAYLFAPKQGFSKFGSYVGNGNANGTFVYTGFRPAMVIIKTSSYASQNWNLYDTKRDIDNITEGELNPNDNSSEDTSGNKIDILSNGFKCKVSYDATNRSGETYIYMAWAEAPLVNSEGVPCNAR